MSGISAGPGVGVGGTWKGWHEGMQARSALFDLYGDYLRPRGGRAPVASLVRLLAPLGITAPAVRTAVSRMVRQGWLHPLRLSTGPGYLLTPKAARRLDEAAARIYRTHRVTWEGTFDLVVLDPPGARPGRARLAQNLAFLGYGSIDETTWVATRAAEELDSLLTEAGLRFERFTAQHAAGTAGATALVRRAWNLDEISNAYEQFVRDPQLPPALLPERWAGQTAAAFFDRHATRLRPAADRYVERCLEQTSRSLAARHLPRTPIKGVRHE